MKKEGGERRRGGEGRGGKEEEESLLTPDLKYHSSKIVKGKENFESPHGRYFRSE